MSNPRYVKCKVCDETVNFDAIVPDSDDICFECWNREDRE